MRQLFLSFLLGILLWQPAFSQKLAAGPQVLTIHSDLDDTEQPYALYIPKDYDEKNAYPLMVMLHGAGSNHRLALRRVFGKSNAEGETDVEASRYFPEWEDVNYIVVAPYARGTAGYQGVAEHDVMQILEDVKKRFTIDENRIYLTGLSMGGGGTVWMGLTRPDIWAAIAPVCPAPPMEAMELLGNSFNYPVHFFQGGADPVVPAEGTKRLVSGMQAEGTDVSYVEYPGVLHDSWVNAYADGFIFDWFDSYTRNPNPMKVKFATKQLKYDKAYWVQFTEIAPGKLAEIEATFQNDGSLNITTANLLAFSLDLAKHPDYNDSKPLTIRIDGETKQLAPSPEFHLYKDETGWNQGIKESKSLSKRRGLEGPIFDAFSQRHVYVFGTLDNPSDEELAKRRADALEAANWSNYRGEFLGRMMFFPRVISDKEVRPSDLEDANLILFGDANTNSMIAGMKDILPIHLAQNDGETGLLYIYPQGENYVVINSGLNWWANLKETGYPFVSLTHRVLPQFKDYILFEKSIDQPLAEGYFENDWTLSTEAKETMKKSGKVNIR
ncbi:prolyl oligopeptidase family serine peptidase [Algoriphagus namhaensis]|uniref:Prolyl oligopeptidase family serine peptidase n=1 Tax=Algoriphagus namhaensis TaxID=915353 RepID=A0ABV8AV37_9BACT